MQSLQHLESHALASIHSIAALNRFQPRSNITHAAGEIPLAHQATTEHGMGKCEQLTFWRRNVAIHGLCKLILSSAPIQGRKRAADPETVAHCDKTRFPRWIRIGDGITRRKHIPSLTLTPYGLEQCEVSLATVAMEKRIRNSAEIYVTLHAHWAASPCCGELWTGRGALWTG